MSARTLFLSAGIALSLGSIAQGVVPFTTANDRFVVFEQGKFTEVEPRKPQQLVLVGDQVLYVDDRGQLKLYQCRKTHQVDVEGAVELIGTPHGVHMQGDRLRRIRTGSSLMLSNDAGDVSASDSLICWQERETGNLDLAYQGNVYTVAHIDPSVERPQWQLGRNTFTCFDHSTGTITLFYRGKERVLADSCDMAVVSCGGDIVAYWDDHAQQFKTFGNGKERTLEEFRPVDFQAGDGVAAYTTATLKFRVYQNGTSVDVLDHRPTSYWVQDSAVLYVDRGYFWTVVDGKAEVVEEYVPEQWSIHGGTITYLTLNREIRSYQRGVRRDLSQGDAAIPRYEAFGDAVLYRDQHDMIKVAWEGRVWEY